MNKLSIITVCYNNKSGLERTLTSIQEQTTKDFEYIVIDGASTDGSAELLDKYADIIDYKLSEKDTGIYNAMNKAIKQAKGEYCLFLNSGDTLHDPNTIKAVLPQLGQADFMTGNTICILPHNKQTIWKSPAYISFYLMAIYSLSHQATFIRTSLLKDRPYREDLKIVSDWEQMFYELIIKDRTYKKIDLPICKFEYGGISSSKPELREKERKLVLDEHFSQRVQADIVRPNLLVRIAMLAEYKSGYYKSLELACRIIRKVYGK